MVTCSPLTTAISQILLGQPNHLTAPTAYQWNRFSSGQCLSDNSQTVKHSVVCECVVSVA